MCIRDSSTNAWSVPSTSLFYRNSGNLTAYQYWFDDNVSTLVEMTVGATDVIDITTQINAGALIDGSHTITLRTKDARNGFSVPVTYSFDVITGIAELRGVERVILFPNLAADQVTLRVDASLPQDLQLSVLDASGRTVRAPERLAFNGEMCIRDRACTVLHRTPGEWSVWLATGQTLPR